MNTQLKNGSPDPIGELWAAYEDLQRKLESKPVEKVIDKINALRQLLEAQNVKYKEGIESRYMAVMTRSEAHKIKKKLFQLIEKL